MAGTVAAIGETIGRTADLPPTMDGHLVFVAKIKSRTRPEKKREGRGGFPSVGTSNRRFGQSLGPQQLIEVQNARMDRRVMEAC